RHLILNYKSQRREYRLSTYWLSGLHPNFHNSLINLAVAAGQPHAEDIGPAFSRTLPSCATTPRSCKQVRRNHGSPHHFCLLFSLDKFLVNNILLIWKRQTHSE
ncbi:hypothetical protein OTU49_005183, partial [Cherax quadricarinatus]